MRVTNDEIRRRAGISTQVRCRRWEWIGDVLRMAPNRNPHVALACNHCHIVGTRTPYSSRPPAPTRSMLFTNRKSANSQGARTNCAFQH